MSRRHVSDLMVRRAYASAAGFREVLQATPGDVVAEISPLWPTELLSKWTGEPAKVCYRAMERAERRGLIEYGTSLRSGWLTEEGKQLLADADADTQ